MTFSPSNLRKNILPVVFLSMVMIFLFFLNSASAATYESTFTSRIFDANHPADFGNINWEAIALGVTSVEGFEVKAGNVRIPDSSWTNWTSVTNGQDLSIFDGNRYIQYHVILGTDDLLVTPSLDRVSIEMNVSTLISSSYNTNDDRVQILNFAWDEELNGGDVAFQIRTSSNGLSWTPWCGPENVGEDSTSTCETEEFYSFSPVASSSLDNMFTDIVDDRFIQYKFNLMSDSVGGGGFPVVSSITMNYEIPEDIERTYESTFTSRIIDTNPETSMFANSDFGNVNWETTIPANTSIRNFQTRAGVASSTGIIWTTWVATVNGQNLDMYDGSRYFQYRVTLGTDDLSISSPSLDKVTLDVIPRAGYLMSSIYNSGDSNTEILDLQWNESQHITSDDVLFQLRTSPNNVSWTDWCGPDDGLSGCDNYSFFTEPDGSESIDNFFSEETNDRYVQYKLIMKSSWPSGNDFPVVSSTTLDYNVPDNSPRDYESLFTSRIFDTNPGTSIFGKADFGILHWDNDIPADTSVRNFETRAGVASSAGIVWTAWATTSNWQSLDMYDGNRYFQYRVILGTDDLSITPSLNEVSFDVVSRAGYLISSVYNSDENRIIWEDLTWEETKPGNSEAVYQVRTSSNGLTWTNWCGPEPISENSTTTCNLYSFFTEPDGSEKIDSMFSDSHNDQYAQYRTILEFGDLYSDVDNPLISTTSLQYDIPTRIERDYESNFTSRIFPLGNPFELGGIYWGETIPADTSIIVSARFGTGLNLASVVWSNGGSYEVIHNWEEIPVSEIEFTNVSSGVVVPEEYDGSSFVQYQVTLGTDDLSKTPSFDKFLVEYFGGHLISSAFDAASDDNAVTGISWDENRSFPVDTDMIRINLRTASLYSQLFSSEWHFIGSTTKAGIFTSGCSITDSSVATRTITCDLSSIPLALRDNVNDRFMQYRLDYVFDDSFRATPSFPVFYEMNIDYIKNAPPEFGAVTSSQETIFDDEPGKVKIDYEIRDDDYDPGTSYTYITPYFEYSSDGGANWNPISSTSLTFATTSPSDDFRDANSDGFLDIRVDENNHRYRNYLAYWDVKNYLPGVYATGTNMQIRIIADDWETMFNKSTSTAMSFDLDTKDPTYSDPPISISGINAGTNYTTATITLTSFVDESDLFRKIGFNQEILRNNPGFAWSDLFGGSGISTTIQLETNPDIVYARVTDLYNNGAPIFGVASDHNMEGYAYIVGLPGRFANFSCYYDYYGINNCTATSTFGVSIDRHTLNLSGYAYVPSSGDWISFESSSTPPNYDFNSNCISTCDGSTIDPYCTACYSPYDNKLYGWALLNGNQWISLNGSSYDIFLDTSPILPVPSPIIGSPYVYEFLGNGLIDSSNDIYFNNSSGGPTNDLGGNPYRVLLVNQSPATIASLNTLIPTSSDLCNDVRDALNVDLGWAILSSDPLESSVGYEVQVSESSIIVASTTGTSSPGSGGALSLSSAELDYNLNYSWRIKVKNYFGLWSSWVDFDYSLPSHQLLNSGLISEDGDFTTFTTYLHEFPEPYFKWIPEEINQNTAILFTATSSNIFADWNGNRATPVTFSTSSYDSLLWEANDYDRVDIYSTTTPTTTIKFKFTTTTNSIVTLTITDHDYYTCSTSSPFNIYVLPDWIEVKTRD